MKPILLLLGCALLACSSTTQSPDVTDAGEEQPPPPPPPPPPPAIVVEVGTGSVAYAPLEDGGDLSIVHGPQGSTHLWGAFRATSLTPGTARVRYTISLPGPPEVELSSAEYLLDADANPWERAGLVGLLPSPDEAADEEVLLTVSIEDTDGQTGSGTRRVVPRFAPAPVGSGTLVPAPRSDFAAALDPEGRQLVLFGGDPGTPIQCTPAPRFDGETWLLDLATSQWTRVDGEGPSARSRPASAFDSKRRRLLVYGGRSRTASSGPYTLHDDLWSFDLASRSWSKLTTNGPPPPALTGALAVYDALNDRLVLIGGNSSADGLRFEPRQETWVLSLAENTWSQITDTNLYPGRHFHAGVWDGVGRRVLVFGGAGQNTLDGPFYTDLWSLDVTRDSWRPLVPEGTAPSGRIHAQAVLDSANRRVLLFGGRDTTALGARNDLWALELSPLRWVKLRDGDTENARPLGICDFPADFTTPDLASPERREAAFLGYDSEAEEFVLAGGRTDCGPIGDLWTLNADASVWTRRLGSTIGESCARSGRQSCTRLCF